MKPEIELDDLPPILRTIADVAGMRVAHRIARVHGGTRVKVPLRADGRNWLTALVGHKQAAAIIDALGAKREIDVPLGPEGLKGGYFWISRRQFARRLDALEATHASAADIARSLGVTERTVRNHRAARRRAAGDPRAVRDLFE